jgi:hypothetical protein
MATTTEEATMKYMLMLRHRDGEGPDENDPAFADEMKVWDSITSELRSANAMIWGGGLAAEETATTVRAPGGERTVTDGPFAETKELLFSVLIVDLPDLDAAVDIAGRMPAADYGSVEIRPLAGPEQ